MRFKVAIGRPTTRGEHRAEVANFTSHAWKTRFTDDWCKRHIIEMADIPVCKFPTDTARNCLVRAAQEHDIDYLFMIDEDAGPNLNFFKDALQFLSKQKTPSIIGCPYMSADGQVQVFRFVPRHSTDPIQPHWKIDQIPRSDAFNRKGIERVASIGTHCICYDMRVFDIVPKPYFRYSYDQNHEVTLETEECYFHRSCLDRELPIFVDWEKWASHYKIQEIGPLAPIKEDNIPAFWRERAKDFFLYTEEGRKQIEAELKLQSERIKYDDNSK